MLFCQPHDVLLQVEDPSKYGVVVMDGQGVVERFVEKPKVDRLAVLLSHGGAWVSSAMSASGHNKLFVHFGACLICWLLCRVAAAGACMLACSRCWAPPCCWQVCSEPCRVRVMAQAR